MFLLILWNVHCFYGTWQNLIRPMKAVKVSYEHLQPKRQQQQQQQQQPQQHEWKKKNRRKHPLMRKYKIQKMSVNSWTRSRQNDIFIKLIIWKNLINIQNVNILWYSVSRLIWSLWADIKVITITGWFN